MIVSYPLNDIWPRIEPKLKRMVERQGKPAILVGKIYELCLRCKCLIFCCTEDESFAIVEPRVDPDTGENILYVWAVYGENGQRGRNVAYLREIATRAGAKRLVMTSKRRGFERTGWKVQDIVYSLEV